MDLTTIKEIILQNENLFYTYCVLVVVTLLILIVSWFGRKRIGYASKFGKMEHFMGRFLGVMLIITFFIEFFNVGYTLFFIVFDFGVWFVYLISHTAEKFFYGSGGPRG